MAHEFYNTDNTGTVRAVISAFTDSQQIAYFTNSVADISKFKKALKKVEIDV